MTGPLPVTGLVLVRMGAPAHVALSGPNRVKVIPPAGLKAPARKAVSLIVPPAGTDADAWVVSSGTAWVTTTISRWSSQGVVADVDPPRT